MPRAAAPAANAAAALPGALQTENATAECNPTDRKCRRRRMPLPAAAAEAKPGRPLTAALANGLRAVAVPMPWRETVAVSVYLRTGSLHEPRKLNGISHVVEHMAFKGTARRDCQRINFDAEKLGAEVNAHTDKDHTGFHIEGLPGDVDAFVELLADIVLDSSFPADELERERQVILQEFAEVEEDPVALAFQLFDRACYGLHPAAQPVIGNRANLERLTRDDLLRYVQSQYTARNCVVAAAGPLDADAFFRSVEAAFGAMPTGDSDNAVAPPAWRGGIKLRRLGGSSQCQIVVGFEAPALADPRHRPHVVAAALFGEGMSSPLLDQVRERRGLAYHAACAADIFPIAGQFVVDAATAPAQAEAFLAEAARLLREHADAVDGAGLARARNQIAVRQLRAIEQPGRRLEAAAQDLFTFGRLRDPHEELALLRAVSADEVRAVFGGALAGRAGVAFAGSVPPRLRERAAALFDLGRDAGGAEAEVEAESR